MPVPQGCLRRQNGLHCPSMQAPEQGLPQVPQLAGSWFRSLQTPLQHSSFLSGVLKQDLPHALQCNRSIFVHVPLQHL
jgi:hypothetical protein